MVAVILTVILLPIIAWMIDMAARRRGFVADFIVISVGALLYVVVVRSWMTTILGDSVSDIYAMPTLVGGVVAMIALRWVVGRWYRPHRPAQRAAASTAKFSAHQSKYAGYRRTSA